ncbi:MAG: polysaccharide deacetylase family protein [Proteobacteria bacterium]|nr:polysaccharide deacetylase family protein [Pseudomonadota bacterium]
MRNVSSLALISLLGALLPVTLTACATEEDEDTALFESAFEDNAGGKEDGGCSGVVVPDRSGFGKHVALTFDDGPNPATTPKVIEILKRHHAPATFFNNGSRYAAAGAKELAARIAADPDYILANHSQHHLNLAEQTAAKVATEVDGTDALIRAAGETPKYFRFPFGSANCSAKTAVQDRGYIVTGWHIDSADWCFAAGGGTCKKSTFRYVPDEMRNDMQGYVMSQVRSTNGGIILFHDIHQSTADHLDAILTAMEHDGFSFVRLDDTTVFPKLHGKAPATTKFIGDTCTTNADCNFTGGHCHAAGFCTQACAGTCPDASGKAPTFCIADEAMANTGMCVSKPTTGNGECHAIPNTENRIEARFIGTSSSSPASANVCAPL